MTLDSVGYVHETLSPGNPLTLTASVKNNSIVQVNGVHVSVVSDDEEIHSEDIEVAFSSGEEDILYINYNLPEMISSRNLTITVTPLDEQDIDETDNTKVCRLSFADLSIEDVAATKGDESVAIITQVVNRGQVVTNATTLTFRKGGSDGVILGTAAVDVLGVGELVNVQSELYGIDAGETIYVEVAEIEDENLIGNNSSHATVLGIQNKSIEVSANATRTGNDVSIDIDVENPAIQKSCMLQLIVAAYDKVSGKQIYCEILPLAQIEAINCYAATVKFVVGADTEDIIWKVFSLGLDSTPVLPVAKGAI